MGEIERVVGEYQARQEELKRASSKAEEELDRLEAKELEIVRELVTEKKRNETRKNGFSGLFFIFSLAFIVLIAVIVNYCMTMYIIYMHNNLGMIGLNGKN